MAQRTENEETEFKVPETLTLCINNCGVTGNPATNNMCQKCFNATTAAASAATTTTTTSTASSSSNSSSTSNNITTTTATTATTSSSSGSVGGGILKFNSGEKQPRSGSSRSPVRDPATRSSEKKAEPSDQEKIAARKEVNRCSGCRRKVGLTGFRCRCGELFCWEHRYSDRHDCSYDYKAAGREAIARENPVVKAAKIVRV